MVHCKHEYEPSIQQRQVQYGKVKKSHEHNSRGIAVFCLPHFMDNLCYLFVSSGAKKYLSPAGNQEGKKKVMQIQENPIMFLEEKTLKKNPFGDAGFRTQDLLHAKQTFYH